MSGLANVKRRTVATVRRVTARPVHAGQDVLCPTSSDELIVPQVRSSHTSNVSGRAFGQCGRQARGCVTSDRRVLFKSVDSPSGRWRVRAKRHARWVRWDKKNVSIERLDVAPQPGSSRSIIRAPPGCQPFPTTFPEQIHGVLGVLRTNPCHVFNDVLCVREGPDSAGWVMVTQPCAGSERHGRCLSSFHTQTMLLPATGHADIVSC